MRLYELTKDFDKVRERVEHAEEGELMALYQDMNKLEVAIEIKLDNTGKIMRELESESAGVDAEIERLKQRKKHLDSRAEWLKSYVAYCLGEGNSIKTPLFSFSWRKSESVEIFDASLVPEQYQRVKNIVEPDKTLIKQDLKAGAKIPGCGLLQNQSLQIK